MVPKVFSQTAPNPEASEGRGFLPIQGIGEVERGHIAGLHVQTAGDQKREGEEGYYGIWPYAMLSPSSLPSPGTPEL